MSHTFATRIFSSFALGLVVGLVVVLAPVGCRTTPTSPSPELVRYGGMHETIGRRQHQGRVELADAVARPHFYGVGAVAGPRGEITIVDSAAVATGVGADGRVEPLGGADVQATLLVGRSITRWSTITVDDAVAPDDVDARVAVAAKATGLDPKAPFMFVVEGVATDVRLHVINGACPLHARMRNLTLAADEQPYELETETRAGTVVGVHAAGSVGELTHPATSVHAHLVWQDEGTAQRVTGHLERFGLAPGAVLTLPSRGP